MAFKVIEILNGEDIKVNPNWAWTNPEGVKLVGNTIKIKGYKLPNSNESHSDYAIAKLKKLIENREVVLKNPSVIEGNSSMISCNVFIDNVDVSHYFPEY
ncbi:hypothetical protein [Flavobacterium litorale]|uniref:Uncharacterized protein n=1 Tax=Flavobacterium litorale TaxID=2856519 RepID=A0ABX8V4G9_9FLAO|nr:hypothetical protein [Flavobacterium litorale]QYJ67728.1 hypothetical protein K1I41_09255 [Flavobacterium litorale]